jgi:hypothetical protein
LDISFGYLSLSLSLSLYTHIFVFIFNFLTFRTATAEGQEMKQVLSTFSKLEQSRFEAFRKASFPGDAIGTYVAHCLINEQHRSVSTGGDNKSGTERGGEGNAEAVSGEAASTASIVSNSTRLRYLRPTTTTTTAAAATSKRKKKKPILSDVVATGQSGDITVVVSTLAKAYAQRLVLAARKYSIERRNKHKIKDENENNSNDDHNDEEVEEEDIAISPEDILKAYADREVRGLDPGFFLQARGTNNNSGSSNSGCTNVNLLLTENDQRYTLNRSVVLSAQDEYYNNNKDKDNDYDNDGNNDNDNDNMEIDVDDEHNNNNNVDTTNGNNAVADKDEGDNDGKNNNGDEDNNDNTGDEDTDDDDDDPIDESVKLFSLLVNQINARQNGGITATALSSSDYYDDIIGIDSDIIADSKESNNNKDDNKNEIEKEGVVDKKEGISNSNNDNDNNVTATEAVVVPMDTSSDGITAPTAVPSIAAAEATTSSPVKNSDNDVPPPASSSSTTTINDNDTPKQNNDGRIPNGNDDVA